MLIDLLPCAHCGSEDDVVFDTITLKKRQIVRIECEKCSCSMQRHIKFNEDFASDVVEDLVNAWNTRIKPKKARRTK